MTNDSIVSPKRRKEILSECVKPNQYFICHKSSIDGDGQDGVLCRSFFDKLGDKIQVVQIAKRLGVIKYVDQPNMKKLPTYSEMYPQKNKI